MQSTQSCFWVERSFTEHKDSAVFWNKLWVEAGVLCLVFSLSFTKVLRRNTSMLLRELNVRDTIVCKSIGTALTSKNNVIRNSRLAL